jgi:hypothetical protein
MSSKERCLVASCSVDGGDEVTVGFDIGTVALGNVEAGFDIAGGEVICPTASDFSEAETVRNSSETFASVTVISSTFSSSWLSFSFSALTMFPFKLS